MKGNVVNRNFTRRVSAFLLCAAAVALFQIGTAPSAFADSTLLGSPLDTFAVLGGAGVTNTGKTTINNGNVGAPSSQAIVPGSSGFVFGGPFIGTAFTGGTANTAEAETVLNGNLDTALSLLSGLQATGGTIAGGVLNGLTLTQGVYAVSAAAGNGGFNLSSGAVLTLDAQGNSNPFWVFQMSSTLITGSGSVVKFVNQGANFNPGVYWDVASSATLGTTTSFQGNILADTSIQLQTGATIGCGSALSDTASVTLDTNTITTGCNGSLSVQTGGGGTPVVIGPPGPGGTGGTPLPTPEPDTLLLLGAGFAGLGVVRRRLTL